MRPQARKSLGQHFLTDANYCHKIVQFAEIGTGDTIVEIGPGTGQLTAALIEIAHRVIAVEFDRAMVAHLEDRYPKAREPNLQVVQADILTFDWTQLPTGPLKVVGNLPYNIATRIIRRIIEMRNRFQDSTIMVQKEVADSMVALPGRMGLLSVATQLYAEAQTVCIVPPEAFFPPPAVTSAVVKLVTRAAPAVAADDGAEFVPSEFFDVVRAGFSAPRKQLRNSISHGLGIASDAASGVLDRAGIDGQRRAQTLDLAEWGRLYRAWRDRPSRNRLGI